MRSGQSMDTIRRGVGALVTAAIVALVAACGGDDSTDKPATQTGGTSLGAAEGTVAGGTAPTAATASPAGAASPGVPAAAQPGNAAIDPCRLVSEEELEAALGVALNPGQGRAGECAYKAQSDANPGTMPSVTVTIQRSRTAPISYDALRKNASSRAADVPGLGDKAYVDIGSGVGTDFREIGVLKGDVFFSINLTAILNPPVSMSNEEKSTRLVALARTALGRL